MAVALILVTGALVAGLALAEEEPTGQVAKWVFWAGAVIIDCLYDLAEIRPWLK